MEISEYHRKNGYGALVTAKSIQHCLENGYTPVRSCNFSNKGSYALASKLGFEPTFNLSYYQLR